MSDENKKLKFKTTTQEIKFKRTGRIRTKTNTTIEEYQIPSNELDRFNEDKISLLNNNENKLLLTEENKKSISLDENIEKISLSEGNDNQSLTISEVDNLVTDELHKQPKKLNIPSKKNSYIKKPDEPTNNKEVIVDFSKRHKSHINETESLKISDEKEITRHSFSNNDTKPYKSSWGTSSLGKKKPPKKSEQTLEEEENGIYRTSTIKKPKRKPKDIVDEEGYTRSSKKPVKTYSSTGKKEYIYNEEKLYNYGINRLSEQDYGRHELFKKMKNLQENEEIINKVLDKLEGQKYLSDNNRIRSFLMSYSNSESINKTKQRLIQKGFSKKAIDSVIEDMEDSGIYQAIQDKENEEEKALSLLIRRYRIYELDKKEKMSRFLISKGFSFDIISKVMKTFSNGEFDSFDPY